MEVPDDYNELQKWASEHDIDGVNGNSSKEELKEAYREHENGDISGDEIGETGETGEIEMEVKPSRDAPEGETMFNGAEDELESSDQQKETETDSTDAGSTGESDDNPGQSGDEEGKTHTPDEVIGASELSKDEVEEIHHAVNQGMATIGRIFGYDVKEYGRERLEEIAEKSKQAVNMVVPNKHKERAGMAAAFTAMVTPHIEALRDGDLDRMNDSDAESEAGENNQETEPEESDDRVIDDLNNA